ncbi:MAG: TIGR03905 family TSCPD domain-containing protein [Synergistaceae bacterium]|nr:TIGR03905 family TSCPD domain-containing protein [Synergistaceae bacterium]MBQ6738463.1 TIGR03905 family TSCPD domain-containing protein [Synergistaceae bacterium]MBQ7068010.1 TIGR03905 family TSCPD domain-containing protein [Synergistaceae bacterium]MBR0079772.1 TIGR03905 family TSCPD domain-containing protein [Synergistaceae bacterium]MBR0234220.1 TIGR03905 family TSCPD domain-containing protein [Synergistaceae bacterium]
MKFDFVPNGVCARKITFNVENGRLYGVNFVGGCPGNLSAIVKLLEGSDAMHAVKLLKGNQCGTRGTSCVDQLAIAIEHALIEAKAS